MDNDEIKAKYFKEHIEKGIKDIFEAQRKIALYRIYQVGSKRREVRLSGQTLRSRSGLLKYCLTYPNYSVETSGGGVISRTSLPTYIRFLDMEEFGNFRIYNRQIWGILYTETMQNIKYEYRDWLKEKFPELLEQCNY